MRLSQTLIVGLLGLLASCGPSTPESIDGLWRSEGKLVRISSNEHHYGFHTEENRPFYQLKDKVELEMKDAQLSIKSAGGIVRMYSPITDKMELQLWVIAKGMGKDFVLNHFHAPNTILMTKAGAEQWFYSNNNMLVFFEDKVLKVHEQYLLNKDFSQLEIGMTKEQVVALVGNPDRKNDRDTKWYYGLEQQLVFREDQLTTIRDLDPDTDTSADWRKEALATFDDSKLIKRDADFLTQKLTDIPIPVPYLYGPLLQAYGIPERANDYLPMITIGEMDTDAFPTSLRQMERDLGYLKSSLPTRLRSSFPKQVDEVLVKDPTLDKARKLVRIDSVIELQDGRRIEVQQAIFFRYNELLLLQMMVFEEGAAYLEYFQDILKNFDI